MGSRHESIDRRIHFAFSTFDLFGCSTKIHLGARCSVMASKKWRFKNRWKNIGDPDVSADVYVRTGNPVRRHQLRISMDI